MMNEILRALRSPGAMMVALVLALFPQGEHTAQVFAFFSHNAEGSAQFFSYAFAAAVEVAVLLFVLAGHRRISYLFAGASFLTNVVYYAIGGVVLLSVAAFPVLLLSALLPACIVGYSHTIADVGHATPATKQPAKRPAPARRWFWQFWRKPAETPVTNIQPSNPAKTPVALPAGTTGHPIATPSESGGHSEVATQTGTTVEAEQAQDLPTHDARTQALQLRDEGYTAAEIARMTGAKYSTVQSWLRRATVQTNGTGAH